LGSKIEGCIRMRAFTILLCRVPEKSDLGPCQLSGCVRTFTEAAINLQNQQSLGRGVTSVCSRTFAQLASWVPNEIGLNGIIEGCAMGTFTSGICVDFYDLYLIICSRRISWVERTLTSSLGSVGDINCLPSRVTDGANWAFADGKGRIEYDGDLTLN